MSNLIWIGCLSIYLSGSCFFLCNASNLFLIENRNALCVHVCVYICLLWGACGGQKTVVGLGPHLPPWLGYDFSSVVPSCIEQASWLLIFWGLFLHLPIGTLGSQTHATLPGSASPLPLNCVCNGIFILKQDLAKLFGLALEFTIFLFQHPSYLGLQACIINSGET